jgi:hypothetical protein
MMSSVNIIGEAQPSAAPSPDGGVGAARRRLPASCCSVVALCGAGLASAQAQLTIRPTTWNVIGLDSNNVNVGPNTFQVGARVCNTGGTTLNNVEGISSGTAATYTST